MKNEERTLMFNSIKKFKWQITGLIILIFSFELLAYTLGLNMVAFNAIGAIIAGISIGLYDIIMALRDKT